MGGQMGGPMAGQMGGQMGGQMAGQMGGMPGQMPGAQMGGQMGMPGQRQPFSSYQQPPGPMGVQQRQPSMPGMQQVFVRLIYFWQSVCLSLKNEVT